MAYFALTLLHGPAWDDSRPIRGQQAWEQHAVFMDQLVEDGFVIIGGPVGDGEQTLHAVAAADQDQVTERMAGARIIPSRIFTFSSGN
jgi:hypothetical protein